MNSEAQDLRDHAERFRRLASIVKDEPNRRLLVEFAVKLDEQADDLCTDRSKGI